MTWSQSFARQSLADLTAHETLVVAEAAKSQRLHFLQMAAEKLCKAYLAHSDDGHQLAYNHCIIAKHLPTIVKTVVQLPDRKRAVLKARLRFVRHVSVELDALCPACIGDGSRPDNSEYPWITPQGAVAPCEYSFPNIDDHDRRFVELTKIMRVAAESYV